MCKDQIQHCVKTDICRADTQHSFKLDQFMTHLVAKKPPTKSEPLGQIPQRITWLFVANKPSQIRQKETIQFS